MNIINQHSFVSYDFSDAEKEAIRIHLNDPVLVAFIQSLVAQEVQEHLGIPLKQMAELPKYDELSTAFLKGVIEFSSKLLSHSETYRGQSHV